MARVKELEKQVMQPTSTPRHTTSSHAIPPPHHPITPPPRRSLTSPIHHRATTSPSHHPTTHFTIPPQAFGVKSAWNDRVIKATVESMEQSVEKSVEKSVGTSNPWIKRLEGQAAGIRTHEEVVKVSEWFKSLPGNASAAPWQGTPRLTPILTTVPRHATPRPGTPPTRCVRSSLPA